MLSVKPSLEKVDVLCEVWMNAQGMDSILSWSHFALVGPHFQVSDVSTLIPRNSIVEANQSGLIAEPLLDVTPQVWSAGCCVGGVLNPFCVGLGA